MKEKIKNLILKIALKYIVWFSRKSKYITHAKSEFKIAWPEMDNMQDFMCKQIIELLSILATHGDSGSSIIYKLNLFEKMAKFRIIAPLTFKDDEFSEPYFDDDTRQNKRDSRVFKSNEGYNFLDDFICKEKYYIGEKNVIEIKEKGAYIGGVFVISDNGDIYHIRKGYIKDTQKFKDKSIYIDVYTIEYPKGWYINVCKESELSEYFKMYSVKKNYDLIQKELDYDNGEYRNSIIDKIEFTGKHMYGESFRINLK